MFLSLKREDFTVRRFSQILPVYGIALTVLLLLVCFCFLWLENSFEKQETVLVTKGVEKFIHRHIDNKPTSILQGRQMDWDLEGLGFVRLVKEGEHLLFTSGDDDFSINNLTELPPTSSGFWLSLDKKNPQKWTILSITHQSGLVVQGGYYNLQNQILLYRLKESAKWLVFFGALFLWIPSFVIIKLRNKPLMEIEEKIYKSLAENRSELELTKGDYRGEAGPLYKQLNRLLKQNRQLINKIQSSLDNVAHDLRTPMTRLRSVAEYGLHHNSDEEMLREALADCLEESERVLNMLRIMMSVAEAESGTMRLEKTAVRIYEILEDVLSLYEYLAEEKRISLDAKVDHTIVIMADRTRLTQVIANLIDNGIKYTAEGGAVTVRCCEEDGQVVFTISDNGMGISDSEIDKIWERLYRGDRSRTTTGLGLGLNYVKSVTEAHGGNVKVESTLNEGTSFTLIFPHITSAGPSLAPI